MTSPSRSAPRLPAIKAPALPLPAIEELSTGAGLLVGAVIVALPGLVGPDSAYSVDQVTIGGFELKWSLFALGAIFAILGILDLAGRRELRSGGTILAFGAAVALGFLLLMTLRDALAPEGDGVATSQATGIVIALWGSALAAGSLLMGPTRMAVLIGMGTIGAALLLPVVQPGKPDPSPALGLLGKGDGLFVAGLLAIVLVAGVARLLDLPRPILIVLGVVGLVATVAFPSIVTSDAPLGTAAAMTGAVAAADVLTAVLAGCAWISLGTLFGKPGPDF